MAFGRPVWWCTPPSTAPTLVDHLTHFYPLNLEEGESWSQVIQEVAEEHIVKAYEVDAPPPPEPEPAPAPAKAEAPAPAGTTP